MFTGLVQAVGRVERRGRALLVEGCAAFSPWRLVTAWPSMVSV